MTEKRLLNLLMETRRRADKFLAPRKYRNNGNLSDTVRAAQPEVDYIDPIKPQIRELLHQRASDRAISVRWNVSTLVLIYILLTTVMLLTLVGANALVVALVATLGLAIFGLVSRLRSKKLEKKFYQQELHQYIELISNEAKNNFNEAETLASIDSVESLLTQREIEVLKEATTGKTNKEIASALGISEMTVRNHFGHIFIKLGINDRTSAVLTALRRGWVKL